MSYSQALKGLQPRDDLADKIRSQAQTELGRPINLREESLIFSRLTQNQLWLQSQKVFII